jgi:hypothetical protein
LEKPSQQDILIDEIENIGKKYPKSMEEELRNYITLEPI